MMLGLLLASIVFPAGFAAGCWRMKALRQRGDKDWGRGSSAKRALSWTILAMIGVLLAGSGWIMKVTPRAAWGPGDSGATLLAMIELLAGSGLLFGMLFFILHRFAQGIDIESEGSGG